MIVGVGNIYANADCNRIDGGGGTNTAIFAGSSAASAVVTNKATGPVDTLTNIQTIRFNEAPACFTTGTPITVIRTGIEVDVPVAARTIDQPPTTGPVSTKPAQR
ncbi:hypothetical protein [Methylobacterium sp. BTF04]|uniref:hypothetical protein n=1 Tax=Methylobacterium sp. BTF04 TaxID=2708300 RepID=UPI001FEE6170|nr:hypothetical protein [Methylobacterium sp. BTF04]